MSDGVGGNNMSEGSLPGFSTITSPEGLPEHLGRFVEASEGDFKFFLFKHPFLVTMFPIILPLPIEEYLDQMGLRFQSALDEGNWSGALLQAARPYRMDLLLDLARDQDWTKVDGRKFWKLANWVWTDSEMSEEDPVWADVLDCQVPGREAFMSKADLKSLAAMGDKITIYRGVHVPEGELPPEGLKTHSWSTSRETAEWFAQRLLAHKMVPWLTVGRVAKEDVFAYTSSRGEDEIIARPEAVEVLSWEGVANEDLSPQVEERSPAV